MNSGIYKITFTDGSMYIGKSVDIPKRWSQHSKALIKGTHTKAIQDAYNTYGAPVYEVIFECHPDHIDIMETYFINICWSSKLLNSTRPTDIGSEGHDIINQCSNKIWRMSTFEHISRWSTALDKIEDLEDIIESSKDAQLLLKLEEQLSTANSKIHSLINRGFWARVFNK